MSMDETIREWKQELKMYDLRKKDEVEKLEKQNTRESNKKARGMVNGAWNATLASMCGHSQLAIAFLKFPTTEIDSLLQKWKTYMESPQHLAQVERSKKIRDDDIAVAQLYQNIVAHRLRSQRRQASKDYGNTQAGHMKVENLSSKRLARYKRYVSGQLDFDLDEATRKHGYGKLRSYNNAESFLEAPCFTRMLQ